MTLQGEAAPDELSGAQASSSTGKPELDEALQATRRALEELAKALGADPAQAFSALEQAGRQAGAESATKISDSVRRHPLAWIAGALGVGLILGLWRKS